jgi:hypothetical protein
MDRNTILSEYRALRAAGVELNLALQKMLGIEDLKTAARRLGMISGDTLIFETEDQIAVLADYAFHAIRRDGKTVFDRYLSQHAPTPGSTEERFLRALQQSFHTLIAVQRTIPGFGVECHEGPSHRPILIVDVSFSHSAVPGATFLSRLSSPGQGWHMTTGAALPVDSQIAEALAAALRQFILKHRREPDEFERQTLMTRTCLKAGASQYIRYTSEGENDPDAVVTSPLRRQTAKVGRNDPCPCGSGRKFKKCCGIGADTATAQPDFFPASVTEHQ